MRESEFKSKNFRKNKSFKEDVKRVLRLMVSKRMLLLLPQLLWIGASIAIYSSMLVSII